MIEWSLIVIKTREKVSKKQRVFCLDFENTLVPEFWPALAAKLGIDELKVTTQEYPDFPDLMDRRIAILNEHGIKLPALLEVADALQPLEGAQEFITQLQKHSPRVIIVSDCAEQIAVPMVNKFDGLTYFGHKFETAADGTITGFTFREDNPKQKVVEAMQSMHFEVYAAGDSYNDLTMLQSADQAFFFQAPQKIQTENPQLKNTDSYDELLQWLTQ